MAKKVLRFFLDIKDLNPNFGRSQISDLKILILSEAKLNKKSGNKQVFSVTGIIPA